MLFRSALLRMALYRYRDAFRKINLYRETLLPKARQAFQASRKSFETGKSGLMEVIDAERSMLEFELQLEHSFVLKLENVALIEKIVGYDLSLTGKEAKKNDKEYRRE